MEKRIIIYKYINRLAMAIGLLHFILPLAFWKRIPEQIPTHYNASGIPDAWNYKSSIILIFFVVFFMMGMFAIVNYFLKTSAESQYASAVDKRNYLYLYPMMAVSNLIIQVLFAYITICSVTCRNLGIWFLPVFLTGTFGSIVYYLYAYTKDRSVYDEAYMMKRRERGEIVLSEDTPGECFRTKIDWWLFAVLAGAFILMAYFPIHDLITEGEIDLVMTITFIIMALIILPMFRTRYILYPKHMTIICYGKLRVPYCDITDMKETHNPLSSAALSLDRIQIDFVNEKGGHDMVLISPVHKKAFMRKIEAARLSDKLED